MNEGETNEPTPLVHDGIIYLANSENIVQALDGRTGELIWEHHTRPPGRDVRATRNIAIYEDKVFLATTDAVLVGPRRANRPEGLGIRDRRQHQGLRRFERPDCDWRENPSGG